MKVVILLPASAESHVIYEDAVAIVRILRAKGYSTSIFAEAPNEQLPKTFLLPQEQLLRLSGEDVLLYCPCAGSTLGIPLERLLCRKILLFYGMVPPRYWKKYSIKKQTDAELGRDELCRLADQMDFCMTVSAFTKSVLQDFNYRCPITVRPPLLSFAEYAKAPDTALLQQYENDGFTNFLFVGELAPHKKQEDVIRAFACYQKYCNPKARLFLVGAVSTKSYLHRLKRYVAALELENVIFAGSVSFPQLLAYYHLASLFLCMSAYEGFCTPLIEAMYFGVPILAYNTTSMADVLGTSGVLLATNNPMEAALMADRILRNPDLRREILATQRMRQQQFAYPTVRKQLEIQFTDFLEQIPPHEKKRQKK